MKFLLALGSLLIASSSFAAVECVSPNTGAVLRVNEGTRSASIKFRPELGGMVIDFSIVSVRKRNVETLPSRRVSSYKLALEVDPSEAGYQVTVVFVNGENVGTAKFNGRGNVDSFTGCQVVN